MIGATDIDEGENSISFILQKTAQHKQNEYFQFIFLIDYELQWLFIEFEIYLPFEKNLYVIILFVYLFWWSLKCLQIFPSKMLEQWNISIIYKKIHWFSGKCPNLKITYLHMLTQIKLERWKNKYYFLMQKSFLTFFMEIGLALHHQSCLFLALNIYLWTS